MKFQEEIISRYEQSQRPPLVLNKFISPAGKVAGETSRAATAVDEYLNRQSPEEQRRNSILEHYVRIS